MEFLRVLLLIVEVLSCAMLIGLVLLQKTKGEGLGMAFGGGGGGDALFGARTGNVLTKMTIYCGCIFLGCTLALSVLYAGANQDSRVTKELESSTVQATELVLPTAPTTTPATAE